LWNGCAIGDYDGDGYDDVLLNGYKALALLKNEGARAFQNVTVKAGLDATNRGHMGSGGGFMDLDGNGTLDLVLLNYLKFGSQEKQHCEAVPGKLDACGPVEYKPEFPELWRNNGGLFRDVSSHAGFDSLHGKALALAFSDANGDGRMDFYIGNDGVPADFMENRGNLRFRNVAAANGTAHGMIAGRPIAAMGADWGDFDRNGALDLVVTAFSDEAASLLRATQGGAYENVSVTTELAGITMNPLEFGARWIDFENDGWPDLALACGHVFEHAEELNPLSGWRQPLLLAHNQPGTGGQRRFVNLTLSLGETLRQPIVGRGLATGDFDNDGRSDLLVVDAEGAPLLLHNQSSSTHHWLTFDLKGHRANRRALGARITARAGKQIWVGQISPAGSYLSSNDPRLHFGLGAVNKLDSITIKWPSGKQSVLRDVAANQVITVHE
jgi:enediyne biosynthesis protein E4